MTGLATTSRCPAVDDAQAWVEARTRDRAGRRARDSSTSCARPAGVDDRAAAAVGRDLPAARQRRGRRLAARQRAPRRGGAHHLRAGRGRGRPVRRPSCARTGRSTTSSPPPTRPASTRPRPGCSSKTLDDFRRAGRRPRRRDPRPADRDQRAADRGRPGVRPDHPRRRPHRAGRPRAARRAAAGLARRAPRRRRRAGHGHDRLPGLAAGADVRPRRRRPPRGHGRVPRSAAGPPTSRCSTSCSRSARSWPRWSATPTGRRTTPT